MELRLRQFAGRFTLIAAFVFIACALLLCAAALMPTQKAYAVTDGWNEWGTCEWQIDDQNCLTIRPVDNGSEGKTGYDRDWESDVGQLKKVIFTGSVTYEPLELFEGCTSLESVEGVANLKFPIGSPVTYSGMFKDCSSLKSVDLSDCDFSKTTNFDAMFQNCASLEIVNFGDADLSSVQSFARMFSGCTSLESIAFSEKFTLKPVFTSEMFKGCASLKGIDFSTWDTSSLVAMWEMFEGCTSLEEVDLSNLDLSQVNYLYGLFDGCTSLKTANLANLSINADSLECLFNDCELLSEVNFDSTNINTPVDASKMFSGCKALEVIDLTCFGENHVTKTTSMFENCGNLHTVAFPDQFIGDACHNIELMFNQCDSLKTIPSNFTFGPNPDRLATGKSGIFGYSAKSNEDILETCYTGGDPNVVNYGWEKDSRKLVVPISDGWTQVGTCEWQIVDGVLTIRPADNGEVGILPTTKGTDWIAPWSDYSQTITKIVIPKTIHTSSNASFLFAKLPVLSEVEGLENLNLSYSISISWMFSECGNIASIDVSGWNTSSVIYSDGVFSQCFNLSKVTLPDEFIGPKCTTINYLFYRCNSLITIPENFSFGSNASISADNVFKNIKNDILETYYYGTDSNVINYDWAGDNRKLVTSQTSELAGTVAIAGDPCEGVTLKATATLDTSCNDAQLRYQWFDASNDQQVSEATDSATFTIPEGSLGKSFYCVVTDASGKYTSSLKSNSVTANHSFGEWEVTKEATCTEAGSQVHTCEKCSHQETETIPAKGHSYSTDWTSDGSGHWHACTVCGDKGDYAGHQLTEWTTTKEPTCTEPGEEKRSCPTCGYEETKEIAALNHEVGDEWESDAGHHWKDCIHCGESVLGDSHDYGDWTVTKQPTCTEDGEQKHSCQTCGWEETEVIPATSHVPSSEWTSDATDHWHICQNCQAEVDKAAHTFGQWITVTEPGEFTSGEKVRTCEVCDYEERAEIPGTGHVSDEQWHFDGTNHWNLCTDCGNQINVEAHDFGEWTVDVPAGCTTEGTEIRTCATCGYEQTQAIPATGHTYGEWTVTTEPTCTEEGVESRTCENCGNTETRVVDELGHNFSADWSSDATGHRHECTRCDAVADEAAHTFGDWQVKQAAGCTDGIEARYCTACNYEETRTIPGAGHQPASEWSSDASGHWHACANCDNRLDLAEHTFGDWTVTADPTEETVGSKERTCEVCGYKDVVEIPALTPGYPNKGTGESGDQGSSEQQDGEESSGEETEATPQTSDPAGVAAAVVGGILILSTVAALIARRKMS